MFVFKLTVTIYDNLLTLDLTSDSFQMKTEKKKKEMYVRLLLVIQCLN